MPNPAESWRRLPALVRFLIGHGALGFVISAVFVGALLLLDPQDAGTLLTTAAGHWWPAVVLWFFTGLSFGAVQIAMATMLLEDGEEAGRPRGGSGAPSTARLVPVRLRAGRRR